METTLTPRQAAAFEAVLARLPELERAYVRTVRDTAADRAAVAAPHWDFEAPARAAEGVIGPDDRLKRALVAAWALDLPGRIAALDLPADVHALYPEWIDRLADFLTGDAGAYDPDFWAKDVRIALALSVPGARTQMIDLSSPLGAGQVLRHARDGWGWASVPAYAAAKGWRPWLEVHTESRELADFNEAGWDRAWATAAEILKGRPDLAGMLGSSWFYDPPLETISPRLAYLRVNPLKHGAFLVHQGPGEIHTLRATAASATRKALIEAGEYTARSWIVAWPRAALIRWADARKTTRQAA